METTVAMETPVAKETSVAKEPSVAKEQTVSPPVVMETSTSHISPRRKPPPPPSGNTEPLDLAGVKYRDNKSRLVQQTRPQSEIIIKRPAPPPPARTVSLKLNEITPTKATPTTATPIERDSREGSSDSNSSNELPVGAISPNTKKRLASYLTRVGEASSNQLETVQERSGVKLPTEFSTELTKDMIDVIRNK